MEAIPAQASETREPLVTGITCPDCAGVLRVKADGHERRLRFICRVGHTYAIPDLLAAEEEKLERLLWQAVTGFEEMVALLRDLEAYAGLYGRRDIGGPHAERLRRAQEQVRRLREIFAVNRPVNLAPGAQALDEETTPEITDRRRAGGGR